MRVYHRIADKSRRCLGIQIGNAILAMLVKFGEIEDAWEVFGRMPERDVFSWNVMVGGYAKGGFLDEAICLYGRMLWAGLRPDVFTLPCVLRACASTEIEIGQCVHAHVFRFGLEAEVDVLNAALTMYAKCGDVGIAKKVFDGMRLRDCISWNALISGHFENDECNKGLALFVLMWQSGIEPDVMTITSVITACATRTDVRLGKGIHGYALKKDFVAEASTYNSLIQMYSGFGSMGEAEAIFLRMPAKDVLSWTTVISGYEKNGFPSKALEVYLSMEAENVSPDEITIASVLAACTCLKRLDIGIKLHEVARRKGLVPCSIVESSLLDMYSKSRYMDKAIEVFKCMVRKDVISWSSIIAGFSMNQRSFEALVFFRHMQADVKPNYVTFIVALSACAGVGALMCGKEIHAQSLRTGLSSHKFLDNAILDLYAKCGRTEYALAQFNAMKKKDVVAWNIMLTGYAEQGRGDLAVALFDHMMDAAVHPDDVTFVALLRACARSELMSKGWELFRAMSKEYMIEPNLKHYACMVDLLSRSGRLKEALDFIDTMPVQPDAAIWGALLNGCCKHGDIELGEVAAKHIFELDPEKVGYYVLLCKLYAECGRWDQVVRVRRMMSAKGLEVDPGCSWIEIKGAVHAFLSNDASHPRISEINGVLQGLYKRITDGNHPDAKDVLSGLIESSKADVFCGHSEKLAVAFGLLSTSPGTPIWVTKNLYMCRSCHTMVKLVSNIVRRDITIRDTKQFHHFRDGFCSCGDEGYG